MPHESAAAVSGINRTGSLSAAAPGVTRPPGTDAGWETSQSPLGRRGMAALLFAIVSGLITLGYHLFTYPLYDTDEGIYMERAWSVITDGTLNPYTYIYDHAPAGWLLAPTIATFFFNFSPLAIYYERMALLDNIMVFWVLLSIYLLLRRRIR